MYKLLIVDDDEIICQGLARCIDWQQAGIGRCDTAYNGREALAHMAKEPADIVLTDVCMPAMDGIELSYFIRQDYPQTKIVLLSAFNEFCYAQKAVSLGVFEYLTKPFTNEQVLGTIARVTAQLQAERRRLALLERCTPAVAELCLQQLLTEALPPDATARCTEILQLSKGWYGVAVLLLRPYRSSSPAEREQTMQTAILRARCIEGIQNQLAELPWAHLCPSAYGDIALLIAGPEKEKVRMRTEEALCQIRMLLAAYDCCFFSVETSEPTDALEELPMAFFQARRRAVLAQQRSLEEAFSPAEREEDGFGRWLEERLPLYLNGYRFSELLYDLNDFFLEPAEGALALQTHQMRAFRFLIQLFVQIQGDSLYAQLTPHGAIQELLRAESPDALLAILQGQVVELFHRFEHSRTQEAKPLFEQLREYIDTHYNQTDLTMRQAANALHISVSYLCYLFRHNCALSFSAYLTQARMEAAIHFILTTDKRSYEIAELVGYNSPQYFSLCFKKHTGCTPNEYRLQHRTGSLPTEIFNR